MKQTPDTISMLRPVFPSNCAGDSFGRTDRRPGGTLQLRNPRFILRFAGSSGASRRAATARSAVPTETYAESSMAHCAFPPARQTGTSLPRADSLAKRRNRMAHFLFGRIPMPHLRWLDGSSIAFPGSVLRCLEQAGCR
jgi:hypothetical protein